ncbi:hypothetical protein [Bradyrhizobium sp. CCGB20]|uniref:hypothetical protein n=1 Tax=Bradyrhizobium sp. CCGB20 TaxID=2949633 RepID=UPI0020B3E84A|nr:hypothetical protein [Bradyrhizobium sp. CCGB20]MCP3397112.1 hypothetical protein [Bradyrhizobium sp. CCGB20]
MTNANPHLVVVPSDKISKLDACSSLAGASCVAFLHLSGGSPAKSFCAACVPSFLAAFDAHLGGYL